MRHPKVGGGVTYKVCVVSMMVLESRIIERKQGDKRTEAEREEGGVEKQLDFVMIGKNFGV